MPIVGHFVETGMVIHDEFRADSASYQSEIFNYCERNNIKSAVGGRMDISVKTIIKELDDSHWLPYQGSSSITCIPHCMNNTDKAFNLIIIRRPWQPDLLDPQADDSKRYVLVATNIDGKAGSIVSWYNKRGDASENRIKELKIGFSMEYMPCGTTKANAVYFRIGVMAYNLFKLFKMAAMPKEWEKHIVQTIRWKFYNTAGKLVQHAGQLWFKVKASCFNLFEEVRARIREFAQATI